MYDLYNMFVRYNWYRLELNEVLFGLPLVDKT